MGVPRLLVRLLAATPHAAPPRDPDRRARRLRGLHRHRYPHECSDDGLQLPSRPRGHPQGLVPAHVRARDAQPRSRERTSEWPATTRRDRRSARAAHAPPWQQAARRKRACIGPRAGVPLPSRSARARPQPRAGASAYSYSSSHLRCAPRSALSLHFAAPTSEAAARAHLQCMPILHLSRMHARPPLVTHTLSCATSRADDRIRAGHVPLYLLARRMVPGRRQDAFKAARSAVSPHPAPARMRANPTPSRPFPASHRSSTSSW